MLHFLIVSIFVTLLTIIVLVVRDVRNKNYDKFISLRRCNFINLNNYNVKFRCNYFDPFYSLNMTYDESKMAFTNGDITLTLQACRSYHFIEITEI